MRHFQFFLGLCMGATLLVACAALKYKYYGLDLPSECYQEGVLLGRSPTDKDWPDLPLTTCLPDARHKGKCVIQRIDDFFNKDKELNECRAALDACQRGKGQ